MHFRKMTPADISFLQSHANTAEELSQWAGSSYTFPLTEEQVKRALAKGDEEKPTELHWVVIDESSNDIAGHVMLSHIERENETARISHVLVSEKQRGKKIGEKLIHWAVTYGFEELNLHRLGLGVFDFNLPAKRCYERYGFQVDGHLRDVRKVNDTFWSIYEMSLLRPEWKK
ncbi:GNAT family N-acetyltransferase [Bacillaceae bacterium SIJ1]|uniref:GNAT family N-acetyltransferase n=1 Tax=Litoribacterium kuwaitense TaxID=1398745 RepID=UPI0013ED724A|nr:GNAT family protein [Litoribacterium kuwaitense]NGP46706.1 GNAT family N-acetyltransferase [Litoribacterium kuwaitense]